MKNVKIGKNLIKAGFILFAVGMLVNVINFVRFAQDYDFNATGFGLCGFGFFLIIVGTIIIGSKTSDNDVKNVKETFKDKESLFGNNIDNISDTLKNAFSTTKTEKKKVWKCEYCGSVNDEDDYKCTSCGAPKI